MAVWHVWHVSLSKSAESSMHCTSVIKMAWVPQQNAGAAPQLSLWLSQSQFIDFMSGADDNEGIDQPALLNSANAKAVWQGLYNSLHAMRSSRIRELEIEKKVVPIVNGETGKRALTTIPQIQFTLTVGI
jgi:hypothetical protein